MSVQSSLYELRHGGLVQNPARDLPAPPVIKLGPEFASLEDYAARIPWVPEMTFLGELVALWSLYLRLSATSD
jgi:hypothetical protein